MPTRAWWDPLLLSTAPHFLALFFVSSDGCKDLDGLYAGYLLVITTSSTLSLLWHASHEQAGLLFCLDYTFAFLWAAYDILLASLKGSGGLVTPVLLLNGSSMLANLMSDWAARHDLIWYDKAHSLWHLLNVSKSVAVSYLVSC
jgi:hypothetical protein